jgi:cysteine desulfurase
MIYLDNAATTPMSEEVRAAMAPYLDSVYGNPSSTHQAGRQARQAVDHARRIIASWLCAPSSQLVFTSGGTEANAMALVGTYLARRKTRPHIVTTQIEHHAVLHTLDFLESLGALVTRLPVDKWGYVDPDEVVRALRPETGLVSVMAVNNELGTIEPLAAIAALVKQADAEVLVHSDMVQALPVTPHPLSDTLVDLASFSAHKIHGPKGIGALYVRDRIAWQPIQHGGQQEHRRRGGTENVAGIVGFGAAVAQLEHNFVEHQIKLQQLHEGLWQGLAMAIPDIVRLSPPGGVPTILNVAFPGVRNDTLLMRLDMAGIALSAGSACTAGSLEPSHVLEACGHVPWLQNAIRFSLSEQNTFAEMDETVHVVATIVDELVKRV